MSRISRRHFLAELGTAAGAVTFSDRFAWAARQAPKVSIPEIKSGSDVVALGRTDIQTSVLGIGTGTHGGRDQYDLGQAAFTKLVRHALDRGLSAAVLQAARPWDTLASCWFTGARVILNHRLRPDSPLGHFSVLAGFDDDEVFVHDPQFGPFRRLTRDRLLRLWLPSAGGSEIVGHVLVAIASRDDQPNRCDSCGAMVPAQVGCGRCGNLVPLRPVAALGCSKRDCGARLWKYVFCPCCDFPTGEVE